ncbi:MAG: glycosyltransferase [Bifidobacterium sp.]|nr:glycosyltransferase [Bifidobacterium sp.]
MSQHPIPPSASDRARLARPWIIAILAVLLMELGFFNLGHWRTASLAEARTGEPTIGAGLKALGGGEYEVTDPATATVTVPVGTADGRPVAVGSVRVVADGADPAAAQTVAIALHVPDEESTQLSARDLAGTKDTSGLSTRADGGVTSERRSWVDLRDSDGAWGNARATLTYTSLPDSQVLLVGKLARDYHATELRATFLAAEGAHVRFTRLEANARLPLRVSPVRLALEMAFAAFLVLFRPRSRLYRMPVRDSRLQWLAVGAFVLVWSVALAYIARRTQLIQFYQLPGFLHWKDTEQYQRLGEALLHGRTWLDLPVDPDLTTMANPYSYADRLDLAARGHQFFWDHAYYGGHYYSYFGVVPAVLLFAPFQLLTGKWLPTWAAIAACCLVATACGTLLVRRVARDRFPRVSLGTLWLTTLGFNLSTNLLQYCHRSDTYGIPIAMAIALTLAGLLCWQCSQRADGTVNPWLVGLGSLLMALDLGTHPQFILASVLAIPMFWGQIAHARTLFSRRSLGASVAALLPYALVAVPLLLYNRARFGSLFDFGATYNLSCYDIDAYHGASYQLATQVFAQLFQPLATTTAFPFLAIADTAAAAPNEPSMGGYFAMVPFACLALLFWCARRRLRRHGVWAFTCVALAVTVAIVLADVSMAATGMRYLGDDAYLLAMCAVLVLFALAGDGSGPLAWRILVTVTVTAVAIGALIAFLGLFVPGRLGGWDQVVPQWYYAVRLWFIGLTAWPQRQGVRPPPPAHPVGDRPAGTALVDHLVSNVSRRCRKAAMSWR